MIEGLKPIKLLPTRERIASALRRAIISRQMQSGETLALEQTAKQLGVSVTPVREAFQILAREGLIELKQNKVATVQGITKMMLENHYQVRAALESEACILCCQKNAPLDDIRNVMEQSKKALESENTAEYSDQNQSFHFEIWIAAKNSRLQGLLSEMWNGLSQGIKQNSIEYATISFQEHQEIFDALEKRDEKRAYEAMRNHILRSLDSISTHYSQ